MKTLLTAGALALACIATSGCAGLGVGGTSGADSLASLKAILTDPNCGHHDEIEMITGAAGIPGSFHAKAVRDCPAPAASMPVPPPSS